MRNPFKLPKPTDLGFSSNKFFPWNGPDSWDAYVTLCKKEYPFRYFIIETLPQNLKYYWRKIIKDSIYWVQCHTLKSYNWHKIDLRKVDPTRVYTHGYLDPCDQLDLAVWASLRNFVEKCQPALIDCPDHEYPHDVNWAEDHNEKVKEILELYNYWTKDRVIYNNKEKELFNIVSQNGVGNANTKDRQAWLDYQKSQEELYEKMFARVIKIRQFMWD